jgi:hypothetical protein
MRRHAVISSLRNKHDSIMYKKQSIDGGIHKYLKLKVKNPLASLQLHNVLMEVKEPKVY